MLKNKLIYVPQKIFQQILPTKATNTPNYQLPINYYDPEGNMVGTYSGINLAANETITHHQLKRFINTHLPEKDRKSTRLNSSHVSISYAVFCLKKKTHI